MNELELKQRLRDLGVLYPFYKTPADAVWGDIIMYDTDVPGVYRVYYLGDRGEVSRERKFQTEN